MQWMEEGSPESETLQVRTLLTTEHRLGFEYGRNRIWSWLRVRCGRAAGGPGLWSGGRIYSRLVWVQHLHLYFIVVFRRHYWPLLGISTSLFLCVWQGGVEQSWLDSSFFRGTGMLLAVLLSFRTKNAVSLRQRTGACVLRMLTGARSLLHFAGRGAKGKDNWARMHWVLSMAFIEAADWLVLHSEKAEMLEEDKKCWGSAESIPASVTDRDLEECFVLCSKVGKQEGSSMACSPRPLLQYLREVCDDVFSYGQFEADNSGKKTNETDKIRRWHRNVDAIVDSIIESFDDLVIFQECIGTQQLRQLINGILFAYLALYPWCVSDESAWVLLMTTLGLACIFYGLDTVAQELETSIGGGGSPIDIDVRSTFLNFFASMRAEELVRGRAREFFQGRAAVGSGSLSELHSDFVDKCDKHIMEKYPATPKAALWSYLNYEQVPTGTPAEGPPGQPAIAASPFFPRAGELAARKAKPFCATPRALKDELLLPGALSDALVVPGKQTQLPNQPPPSPITPAVGSALAGGPAKRPHVRIPVGPRSGMGGG